MTRHKIITFRLKEFFRGILFVKKLILELCGMAIRWYVSIFKF